MPRTAETPGKPATNRIQVLLNDDDKAALDRILGDATASAYVRDLIKTHLKRAPKPVEDRHRHTPGKEVATRTVKGVITATYRCAVEGCDHTMERTS
jgi:hypothetical protein